MNQSTLQLADDAEKIHLRIFQRQKPWGVSSNILRPAPTPSFHTISAFNLAAFFCLWPTWNLGVVCLKAAKSWRWIGKKILGTTGVCVCVWVQVYKFFGCLKFSWFTWKKIRICVPGNRCHGGFQPTRPWLFRSIQLFTNSAQFVHRTMHTNPFAATWPRVKCALPSKVDPPSWDTQTTWISGVQHHPIRAEVESSYTPPKLANGQTKKVQNPKKLHGRDQKWDRKACWTETWSSFFWKKNILPKSSRVQVLYMWNVRRLFLWKFEGLSLQHFPLNFLIKLFPLIWIFPSHTIVEWIEHFGSKKGTHHTETESWNKKTNTIHLFYQSNLTSNLPYKSTFETTSHRSIIICDLSHEMRGCRLVIPYRWSKIIHSGINGYIRILNIY